MRLMIDWCCGSEFLDGLFTGFKALPSPDSIVIEKNYFEGVGDKEMIKKRYRDLVKKLHPDVSGGNVDEFIIMSKQYKDLMRC